VFGANIGFAGWLPDSEQKAETTVTRTPDLEAPAAQSGLSS